MQGLGGRKKALPRYSLMGFELVVVNDLKNPAHIGLDIRIFL